MAIPLLNSSPKYSLVVPSSGQEVRYRPFLVKEQKVLLIAYESQDKKQIINAILDTVASCCDDLNTKELTTFDVDYIFTQIRAKSVGEKVDLRITCDACNEDNDYQLNLEDIQVDGGEKERVIEITDEIAVKLKYPDYAKFLSSDVLLESKSESETLMEIIISCIDSILTEDESIKVKDEPKAEVVKFVDSMTSAQFEKITDFIQKMPTLSHEVKFKCEHCGADNNRKLSGLDDFF